MKSAETYEVKMPDMDDYSSMSGQTGAGYGDDSFASTPQTAEEVKAK